MGKEKSFASQHLPKPVQYCHKVLDMAFKSIQDAENHSLLKLQDAWEFKLDLLKGEITELGLTAPLVPSLSIYKYGMPNPLTLLHKVIVEDPAYAMLCDAKVSSYPLEEIATQTEAANERRKNSYGNINYMMHCDERENKVHIIEYHTGSFSILSQIQNASIKLFAEEIALTKSFTIA